MRNLLLLGAGFSHNWGGWLASEVFDYLLGRPEINGNAALRRALWRSKDSGGFEQTLTLLQSDASINPWDRAAGVEPFEAALVHAFDDMNAGLLAFDDLEFATSNPRTVGGFLARFDAIFTLNQDLLLEHRYMPRVRGLSHPGGQWTGAQLPGLREIPRADGKPAHSWIDRCWTDSGNTQVDPSQQPIFKLHGSTNWRTADGKNVLIFGAAKAQAISNNRLLQSYGALFEAALCDPAAKLMVIGYGFGMSTSMMRSRRGSRADFQCS